MKSHKQIKCPECKGKGMYFNYIIGESEMCNNCNGTGKMYTNKQVSRHSQKDVNKPVQSVHKNCAICEACKMCEESWNNGKPRKKVEKLFVSKKGRETIEKYDSILPVSAKGMLQISDKINELVDAFNNLDK